jgi:curved DNA-binding protein CbpA
MSNLDFYYRTLGLKPGASPEEVKLAYRKLAKIWHPDSQVDPDLKAKAEAEIKKINEAYGFLKNYQPDALPKSVASSETKVRSSAESATTPYERGMDNIKAGNYQEAIEDFTQAIRINPDDAQAYEQRGHACSKLGFEHRAASDFKKARQLQLSTQVSTNVTQARHSQTSQTDRSQTKPEPYPSSVPKVTGKLVYAFSAHSNPIATLTIHPNHQLIATSGLDKTVKLWDISTGKFVNRQTLQAETALALAFSADGNYLAIALLNEIKLHSIVDSKEITSFKGHTEAVESLQFSSSGEMLVSTGRDRKMIFWQLSTGQPLKIFEFEEGTPIVNRVVSSETKQSIISGWKSGKVQVRQLD